MSPRHLLASHILEALELQPKGFLAHLLVPKTKDRQATFEPILVIALTGFNTCKVVSNKGKHYLVNITDVFPWKDQTPKVY